jgi:hypothetical protein
VQFDGVPKDIHINDACMRALKSRHRHTVGHKMEAACVIGSSSCDTDRIRTHDMFHVLHAAAASPTCHD